MKRILFVLTSMYGHVNPNLGLIERLVNVGNEVVCICSKKYSERLMALGAKVCLNESPKEAVSSILPGEADENCRDAQYYSTFNIETAEWQSVARERVMTYNVGIIERLIDFKPDIVFYDSVAIHGLVYAKKNRITCYCVDSATNLSSADPFFNDFYRDVALREIAMEVTEGYVPESATDLILNADEFIRMDIRFEKRFMKAMGRLADCEATELTPKKRLVYLSGEMYEALDGNPEEACLCGFGIEEQSVPGNKKGAYLSRGTSLTAGGFRILCNVFKGVAEVCEDITVSLGGYRDDSGKLSKDAEDRISQKNQKIKVLEFSNQVEELKKAKIFVCHGGLTGVREAIMCETPMVVYPGNFHEYQTGRMIENLGIGIMIKDRKLSYGDTAELQSAINEVMDRNYQSYLINIRKVKEEVKKSYEAWMSQGIPGIRE